MDDIVGKVSPKPTQRLSSSASIAHDQDKGNFQSAMVWTVAVGLFLFLLNAIVFLGIYYQAKHIRATAKRTHTDPPQREKSNYQLRNIFRRVETKSAEAAKKSYMNAIADPVDDVLETTLANSAATRTGDCELSTCPLKLSVACLCGRCIVCSIPTCCLHP